MEIAVLVFDDLTMLDAVGPLEVLARLPDAEVKIVAKDKGPLRAHAVSGGIGLIADHALSDVPSPDILLVPGGFGTRELVGDGTVTGWIGEVHRNTMWTASVCTGALLLGAAGVLDGLRATTHWRAMDRLADYGAIPTRERVVIDGKVITGAGVSAGIDMALQLASMIAGADLAQAIQLQIEYDPAPPFDAGHVDKVSQKVRDLLIPV